jgi:hypothetical protein
MTHACPTRRPGMTLVEILVVIALIILIAGIVAAIANTGVIGSQVVTSAGDRLSGWAFIAKVRAARDGTPRGIRILLTQPDPANNPTYFTGREVQYIEISEPWIPNPWQETEPTAATPPPPPGGPRGGRIVFVYTKVTAATPTEPLDSVPNNQTYRRVFFVSNFPQDILDFDAKVKQNDLLILPEFGTQYRIALNPAVAPTLPPTPIWDGDPASVGVVLSPANCRELVLGLPPIVAGGPVTTFTYPDLGSGHSVVPGAGQPLKATYKTYKFAFQPSPAPLLGEPMLQLSGSTIVDYREPWRSPPNPVFPVLLDADGYRDWRTPTPPPLPPNTANTGPYWPSTTIGVARQFDAAGSYIDILFSPSGQVLYNTKGLICLWVRDPEKLQQAGFSHPRLGDPLPYGTPTQLDLRRPLFDNAGDQILVTIYTRTGLISTHAVAPPPYAPSPAYDPYQFAKDGKSSGL